MGKKHEYMLKIPLQLNKKIPHCNEDKSSLIQYNNYDSSASKRRSQNIIKLAAPLVVVSAARGARVATGANATILLH
jgi:hypothetical protein